uniref:Ig-like domain-containing protein n=1 Tax=Astyanax mexicanus TaxID=7994 RepID=A0A8B9H296_ASTMX
MVGFNNLNLTVWQSPKRINTIEGQSVNINCSFTFNSTTELLKVKWLKNNTEVDKPVHYNISALRSQNFNSRTVSQTSVLRLPSVQLKDSGTYYCKVWHDVPVLREKISEQGTELRVGKFKPVVNFTIVTSPAPAKPFAVTVMGASALGLVLMTTCITAVLCITYKRE